MNSREKRKRPEGSADAVRFGTAICRGRSRSAPWEKLRKTCLSRLDQTCRPPTGAFYQSRSHHQPGVYIICSTLQLTREVAHFKRQHGYRRDEGAGTIGPI